MSKKFDVVAITGTYRDRQGNEKPRYLNIGAVVETKKGGFALKLESIPTDWNGWANLYEPKPREDRTEGDDKVPDADLRNDGPSDEIPF